MRGSEVGSRGRRVRTRGEGGKEGGVGQWNEQKKIGDGKGGKQGQKRRIGQKR